MAHSGDGNAAGVAQCHAQVFMAVFFQMGLLSFEFSAHESVDLEILFAPVLDVFQHANIHFFQLAHDLICK